MSQQIMLDVPDELLQQAREAADRTGSAVENILAIWLKRGAADEVLSLLKPNFAYEVWSPQASPETIAQLQRMLA